MKRVMNSLPTHAGNDILRASLPIMTASRMNDLAAQLLDGLPPKAEKGEESEKKGERKSNTETPLTNGKKKKPAHGKNNVKRERPATSGPSDDAETRPLANGELPTHSSSDPTNRGSRATPKEPLPNGKIKKRIPVPSAGSHRNSRQLPRAMAR